MDVFAGEADVGGGYCFNVPFWNLEVSSAAVSRNLAPFLRGVVLFREQHLALRFGDEDVGRGAAFLPCSASLVTVGGFGLSTWRSKSSSGMLATRMAVTACRFDMPACSAASPLVNLVSAAALGSMSVRLPCCGSICLSSSPARRMARSRMRTA